MHPQAPFCIKGTLLPRPGKLSEGLRASASIALLLHAMLKPHIQELRQPGCCAMQRPQPCTAAAYSGTRAPCGLPIPAASAARHVRQYAQLVTAAGGGRCMLME